MYARGRSRTLTRPKGGSFHQFFLEHAHFTKPISIVLRARCTLLVGVAEDRREGKSGNCHQDSVDKAGISAGPLRYYNNMGVFSYHACFLACMLARV